VFTSTHIWGEKKDRQIFEHDRAWTTVQSFMLCVKSSSKHKSQLLQRCMKSRRGLAMIILSVRLSVRPSVCPSGCQTQEL